MSIEYARMAFMFGYPGFDPGEDVGRPARCGEDGQEAFHFDLVLHEDPGRFTVFRIAKCIDEDLEGDELPFIHREDGVMAYVGEHPDFKGLSFPFERRPDYVPTASVGDVVVLYGRAGYDTPDPFGICSYVHQVYTT